MAVKQPVWHGSDTDRDRLYAAVKRYCDRTDLDGAHCRYSAGYLLEPCPAHRLLASDQRALDGLLAARMTAARLLQREWNTEPLKERDL